METNHLPGLVLAGGQSDNNDAMRWMLERADGGDVVVLRASGSDGYNSYFYSGLNVEVNSVTSIVITSSAQADNEAVLEALNHAEVVFIAGGNQWNYVNHWRDTQMLATLNDLVNNKQITIGGTSAGMAVLGEVIYTAQEGTVWSSEALGDPYHWRVRLEKDFLDIPYMEHTVTDSHYNRIHDDGNNRHGRHVAFMARMVADWEMPARGVAANEYTAIAVDENGMARVFGHPEYPDYAYFLQKHGGTPEVCEEGEPLTWHRDGQALKVYVVKGDYDGTGWFGLDSWSTGEGGDWEYWYVDDGVLHQEEAEDDTSVDELAAGRFSIYPNPATASVNIRAPETILEVSVYTISGKEVLRERPRAAEHQVDLGHLPAGNYVIRAEMPGRTVHQQIQLLGSSH